MSALLHGAKKVPYVSFLRKQESREYLNELYSKFLYNFAYFKCFFWIPAFAGMTSKIVSVHRMIFLKMVIWIDSHIIKINL